jgi:hypothetical protein
VRLNSAAAPACNTLQVYQLQPVNYRTPDHVLELLASWRSDLAVTILDDSIDSDPISDVIETTVRA